MALSLGKTCIQIIRGHLRNSSTTPVLYNTTINDKIVKEVAEASKEDMPVENMKNPFEREPEKCILCKYDITPNYKNIRLLSQFQSSYTGRVYPRNVTGLCKKKQKQIESEMMKAQNAGYMGYMTKERIFLEDPRIFDPERPLRQHSY